MAVQAVVVRASMPVVLDRQIGVETIQSVNARELHAFLGARKAFANWIKDRIIQYRFEEGRDYAVFAQKGINPLGGRPPREYAISLDMAKELAMVERNEKGKQARQYFIECERKSKEVQGNLSDPLTLRTMLLAYTEKVIALEHQVEEQTPKVQFHDAVTEAKNCQTVQEVAKVLGTGPNRLFSFLRSQRVFTQTNLPYQQYLDRGFFRVVEREFRDRRTGEVFVAARTLVTGKGIAFIQRTLHAA